MGRTKFAIGAIVLAVVGIMVTVWNFQRSGIKQISKITGTVIRDDQDLHNRLPVSGVRIISNNGQADTGETDATGFFQLTLNPPLEEDSNLTLQFQHQQYEPLEVTRSASSELWVVRMQPQAPASTSVTSPITEIADVRIRYTTKMMSTNNVGSVARTFDIPNKANLPCDQKKGSCSPDGKWQATIETTTLDAGENREFRNPRVSCIAGPCAFTKVESEALQNRNRILKVSVRNWSEPTTYLIEAEVFHTTMNDMVRRSFPAIFGSTMNFTLPPQAVGPSIEADMGKEHIVFPLGPNLILSWAVCSVKIDQDRSRLFRCELKPGYQFRPTTQTD